MFPPSASLQLWSRRTPRRRHGGLPVSGRSLQIYWFHYFISLGAVISCCLQQRGPDLRPDSYGCCWGPRLFDCCCVSDCWANTLVKTRSSPSTKPSNFVTIACRSWPTCCIQTLAFNCAFACTNVAAGTFMGTFLTHYLSWARLCVITCRNNNSL